MFATNRPTPNTTYLARPVQAGQHSVARNTTSSKVPPAPPAAPPPPAVPQHLNAKPKQALQKPAEVKPIFDRDKLLNEVRSGVQLRHTVTNDKSSPIGVGRVRSGGYSPPPDSVASTSSYSRPEAKKPVFYGQQAEIEEPPAPPAPPPPKAPPPAALLKFGGGTTFDRDKLLSEIHGGVKLRKAVTNDRSAPIGVGTVRNDLSPSPSPSPIPESFASTSELGAAPAAPPPPPTIPPPPSANYLSPQPVHKPGKPITNPALLKLGGKQPVNRDALMASIRGGVKLRKVDLGSPSPFSSREPSPDRKIPQEPAVAPPPPPLLVPPPPPSIPSTDPSRRSRSPKPVLMKLGGKVTVDRDELMRSIRQGVKLRKVVTNDKSSAIINDDDSGVKSPGRSSPSTSNFDDDVYGSQSLSDLSSTGTSRFSSLSNIPTERPNDLYIAVPVTQTVAENGTNLTSTLGSPYQSNNSTASSSPTKPPSSRPQMINVNVDVENYEESENEVENSTLQPTKPKAIESYSSPIPTREQIEAEIPAGSARDRIKLFGGVAAREISPSPVRSLSRPKKSDADADNTESGVARMRKLFKDAAAAEQPPVSGLRNEERERAAALRNGESSIRKMVRKFSIDDDSSTPSQPIWCQKKEAEKVPAPEKTATVKRKTSGTKASMRKKSGTKDSAVRRKSSVKNESGAAATKIRATPLKQTEITPEISPQEVERKEEEKKGGSRWTPPKVDISKFRERFENASDIEQTTVRRGSTSEENAKPGRIKKPPWIKDEQQELPPPAPVSRKPEEATRPSWKKTKALEPPAEPAEAPKKSPRTLKQQESSEHEDSPEPMEPPVPSKGRTTKKPTPTLKTSEEPPPIPTSSPPKTSQKQVPATAEEPTVPTKEGVGPYRYARKPSTTDKKPLTRKDSAGSKKNSALSGGNLLNSVPKPFGTHLSTTGQTTTIGADEVKEEPKASTATPNRHVVFKPKGIQSTKATQEREEAFGDKTATARTAKKSTVSFFFIPLLLRLIFGHLKSGGC